MEIKVEKFHVWENDAHLVEMYGQYCANLAHDIEKGENPRNGVFYLVEMHERKKELVDHNVSLKLFPLLAYFASDWRGWMYGDNCEKFMKNYVEIHEKKRH